ncbi:ABC transporter permease [Larkinella ripae]
MKSPEPKPPRPPRWAGWLLTWLHPSNTLEEVQGDLEELYCHWHQRSGKTRATIRYLLNVVSALPPFVRRRAKKTDNLHPSSFHPGMLRNCFKTAFRGLVRNRTYTFINIAGLTVGLAVCLIIALIIRYETSFDDFHAKKDRIYRVLTVYGKSIDFATHATGVPPPLPSVLRRDIPQFEKTAGIFLQNKMPIAVPASDDQPAKKFKTGVFFVEPSFFDLFDFTWLAGSPVSSLAEPNSAVLTQETAELYFGDWRAALGKTIRLDYQHVMNITGILANPPANTDFQVKIMVPYRVLDYATSGDWNSISSVHQCYVLLPPNGNVSTFNTLLSGFSQKYRPAEDKMTHVLQPLNRVHYDEGIKYSGITNYSGKTTSPERIQTLWLIAAFILIIACVNFINLSTAQALNRSKEVGVRKVLGTNKTQLRTQFLLETLLLVSTSVLLALGLLAFATPYLSRLLDMPLSFRQLNPAVTVASLLGLTLAVTLLAGFYPAVILSGFNPVVALRSRLRATTSRGISLRKVLVVGQFVVAQILITGTLVIVKQMHYLDTSSMGFAKDAIVNVPFRNDSASISQLAYLRDRLLSTPGVQQVSFNSKAPAHEDNDWTTFRFANADQETGFPSILKWVDANYLKTYALPLVAGRNITANDSIREFIVNETVVKKLGFAKPADVLNQEINLWNDYAKGPIVGVVKDFHAASLKDAIHPVFMGNFKRNYSSAGIKVNPANLSATIESVATIWGTLFPDAVFEYEFLDEKIANFYKQEQQLARLYEWFAGLSIFLSCLGLYGLASFMAVQRTKEAGIRKVLGASPGSIVYLFSREFILLIALAFVIASPVAWYAMNRWLENFVYKIDMSGWMFALAGLLTVGIALLTVSFQSIKAALADPVKSLKVE